MTSMNRNFMLLITLIIASIWTLVFTFEIEQVNAYETIYIRADGTVEPEGAPILNVDNTTYTFADEIHAEIAVERGNITINGNGFTLQGSGSGKGFDLSHMDSVTIENTNIKDFCYGVYVFSSSFNTISGNNVINSEYSGVFLAFLSHDNVISDNNVTNNEYGALLSGNANNNVISDNNVTNNEYGICVMSSISNNMYGNNITANNEFGILLESSSYNNLSENTMNDNKYNLGIRGFEPEEFRNSIDVSNLVDGKPVHYLVNQTDLVISPVTYPQIGYLGLIDCANVTIEGLTLTNNGQGLLLVNTDNSKMMDNNLANNECGVILQTARLHCVYNSVFRNNITNNEYGILFSLAHYNIVSRNNITNNEYAIRFDWSCHNDVFGNNITSNGYGIYLHSCKGRDCSQNQFYHNNLMDNTHQTCISYHIRCTNSWSNGIEGNYWGNYTEVDANHDGIGDSSYVIDANNRDTHPLMGMFHSFNTSLGYHVNVVSNSTVEGFEYFESNSTIKMYVSGEEVFGFCRVSIPHVLMNVSNISVIIDHGLTAVLYHNYTLHENDTHKWIYFAYPHSTREIDIIPEFPSFLILPLFMIATLLAVIIYKRKHQTRNKEREV